MAGPLARRIVLFGAGHLGQITLARLRRAGVEPCCFSDNKAALWGTDLHGLKVLSPADAVQRFGQEACFVVTIYNGSVARLQLQNAGCASIVPAPVIFWKYPEQCLPDLGIDTPQQLVEQQAQIRQCYSILSDEPSRHELCDQLEWRYWRSPEFLPLPADPGELYFPSDLFTELASEVFVDGGAFDGDSVRSFLRRAKSFQHLYALEPDRDNLARLRAFIAGLPAELRERVTAWPYALGDRNDTVSFEETHSQGSRVSATGQGTLTELRTLDALPWQAKPTYIKLDIEGSEPFALSGGQQLLRGEMPILAICLYHRSEHLWQIPNLIHSLAPGYAFYLRRYAEDCWEQVCYAVPPARRRIP